MKIGIVGLGGMGSVHGSKYVQMDGIELLCFDPDPERAKGYAERFGATPVASLDDLLAKCDLADLCVPNDLHFELGKKAISSGVGILLEKPMTMSVADSVALAEAAEKAGVPLMVAHVVRYFAEYRRAHDSIIGGAVGKPASARLRRGGLAPTGAGGWFRDPSRSGGVLLDLAIHDFDWLRWTFGEVKSIFSRSVALSTNRDCSNGDYAVSLLTFDSGLVAHVESTWMDPSGFRTTIEVSGSTGTLEHDSRDSWTMKVHTPDGSRQESPLAASDDPYYLEISEFLDSVRAKTPPPVPVRDAIMAVSIATAAMESAKTGRAISPQRV
jgi:predicted dehydrogenase